MAMGNRLTNTPWRDIGLELRQVALACNSRTLSGESLRRHVCTMAAARRHMATPTEAQVRPQPTQSRSPLAAEAEAGPVESLGVFVRVRTLGGKSKA